MNSVQELALVKKEAQALMDALAVFADSENWSWSMSADAWVWTGPDCPQTRAKDAIQSLVQTEIRMRTPRVVARGPGGKLRLTDAV